MPAQYRQLIGIVSFLGGFEFAFLLIGLCSMGYGGDTFGEKNITEAWKIYEGKLTGGVRLRASFTSVDGDGEISEIHAEGELQSPMARYVSYPNETSKEIDIANPKYWATLSKANDANEFTIAGFGPMSRYGGLSSGGLIGDYNSALLLARKQACRGLVLNATILPALVRQSDFSTLSISERDDGMCEWEFDFSPEIDPPNVPIRGGSLVLDPSRYFLVASALLIGEWPDGNGQIRIENTFGTLDGEVPYVTKQRSENIVNGKVVSSWTANVDLERKTWGSEEAKELFFTTGYGLADPALPSNRGILWLLFLAFLALVVVASLARIVWREE